MESTESSRTSNDPTGPALRAHVFNRKQPIEILDHYAPYEKVLDATYPIPFVLQGVVTVLPSAAAQVVAIASEAVSDIAKDTTTPTVTKMTLLQEIAAVLEKYF